MNTLLIKNARVVATMDDVRTELADASVLMRGNVIEAVGPAGQLPALADEVINARRHVVVPGLINTHHHMFQTLTRAVPGAQDAELFAWLKVLYPVWSGLTPEMLEVSTQVAMAELLLSGCTTSSDHLYLFPNGCTLDHSIEAATRIGMRFHATRGAMSVGESMGGLPPDRLVEKEAAILKDTQRLIERWHDPARHAMTRIAAAPCSPFSVSRDLMRESAALARSYGRDHGVRLHTHLAENDNDVAYSREKFGMTPAEYAEDCGWLGDDVWHAHCVKLDAPGIARFGATGTGVAHCPCSNKRLASGIAPIGAVRRAGVPVGLGVDGSASSLDAVRLVARLVDPASDAIAVYFSPLELEKRLPGRPRRIVEGAAAALFEEACSLLPGGFVQPIEMIASSKSAAVGLLESAAEWRADIIVVGARGHGSVERFLLGSVSRAVVHGAGLPVLIAAPEAQTEARGSSHC